MTILKKLKTFFLLLVCLTVYADARVLAKTECIEFSYKNSEEAMSLLDLFMVELQNDPDSTGVIIVYGPRVSKRGEVEAHIKQMPVHFKFRKFDLSRITFINGGYRDGDRVYIVLWRVPAGAQRPVPANTIDGKEVKIKGVFRGKHLYDCC